MGTVAQLGIADGGKTLRDTQPRRNQPGRRRRLTASGVPVCLSDCYHVPWPDATSGERERCATSPLLSEELPTDEGHAPRQAARLGLTAARHLALPGPSGARRPGSAMSRVVGCLSRSPQPEKTQQPHSSAAEWATCEPVGPASSPCGAKRQRSRHVNSCAEGYTSLQVPQSEEPHPEHHPRNARNPFGDRQARGERAIPEGRRQVPRGSGPFRKDWIIRARTLQAVQ